MAAKRDDPGADTRELEQRIDDCVYRLYGLTKAEITLVERFLAMTPASSGDRGANTKTMLRDVALPALKQLSPYFTTDDVRSKLNEKQINITDSTLKRYMSDFMERGVIHDAGRGWYSGIAQRATFDPEPVREIADLLEEQFPLLDAACWSTQQVNPWMHHLLAKFITFVQVDRDGIEAVSEMLRDADYEVYSHPNAARAQEVRPGERSVVVRPLNATAPREGRFSPPEAVLVDLLVETRALSLMSPAEFKGMAQRMASSFRLVMGTLLQYAGKRDIVAGDLFADFRSLTEITV